MPSAGARDGTGRRARLGALTEAPYALLVLTMVLWSGNFVSARAIAGEISPIVLAQVRWALAFLILLSITYPHLRRDWPALRAKARTVVLLGVLGIGIYNTLVYVGLQTTQVVNATLLAAIFPITIAAAGYVVYRDRLTLPQALGIVAASLGALVVLSKGQIAVLASFSFNQGDLVIIAGQWVWAFYTVLLRDAPRVHPMSLLVATILVGQVALAPFTLFEIARGAPISFDARVLAALAYVTIFAAVIAYLCYNRAIALIGSNRASPFFHLIPVFGSVAGVAFLGETVGLHHAAGWALILSGIAIAQLRR
ncbi:DMT family transporter [Acuticoccus sp.]|uniref:DMT family transporter n=1 Tax=Acuticoccus sp. TaxID=1904378 RepID=UPI003B5207FC